MKQLFSATFLIGVVAGLPSTGCLVTNTHHCSYPHNPDRTKCGGDEMCSACAIENDGCVPKDARGVPKGCEQLPLDSDSEGTFSEPTGMQTNSSTSSTGSTMEATSSSTDPSSGSEGHTGSGSGSGSGSSSSSGTPSFCGDGMVDPGEACDDGNADDDDACLSTCVAARCGDGIVQVGVEQCDEESPNCSECFLVRTVFVTSTAFQGNLDGLMGADQKCRDAAMTAMLANPTSYKAWLSDGNGNTALTRLDTTFLGIYKLTDGTPLATGWGDLVDGELAHTIDLDENKMSMGGVVWTNTDATGDAVGKLNCGGWLKSDPLVKGRAGTTALNSAQWTDSLDQACSSPAHVYCFEDLTP